MSFMFLAEEAGNNPAVNGVVKTFSGWTTVLENSFHQAFTQVIDYTPRVVGMVLVLIFGYIAARLIGGLITTICEKIGVQNAAERSGLAQSMQHMGIKRNAAAVCGTIVFWLLMCVFLTAAFNIVGLDKMSDAMNKVVNYIPNLLIATVVMVVGLLIASFLRGVVATSADRVGITYAEHLANGAYYVLALLTFYTALVQLGMELDLFRNLILITFGALAVGFGLAFGLGGRDVVGGILAGYYVRQRLQAGDHVTVGPLEGVVREVGPVATVIETDEHGLLNRHSVPNTKMLNEAIR